MKLTDVEVFAIRATGLPDHLREKLYPELTLRYPHCANPDDVHDATGEWRGVCTACVVSAEPTCVQVISSR
ncbi:hypothetical protein [Burkholderia sp. RS02]|uniref:hypothetical protein n=1 Tax=unclassified Burkholderia TaxID=2613784 RepID=UPI00321892FA